MKRLASWVLVFVSAAACREHPAEVRPDPTPSKPKPVEPVEGVLVHTCAPWDGAAYAIVVGGSCTAMTITDGLRVTVYRDLPREPGTQAEWTFGTNVDNGRANRFVGGKLASELIGKVSLVHAKDGTWSAQWNLTDGKTGERLEQRVKLTECPGRPLCG